MEVTRIFDLLDHAKQYFPCEDMLCGKENGMCGQKYARGIGIYRLV